ncbi:MAG: AI-2E family transporter [Syntrophorhabdaceae bacterium]|nr:AI-2E family transporter [Syntrophorhabdaceae bacterium]
MYRKIIAPVIACLLIVLLGWLVFRVIKPFLPAIGWALAITVMTFPMYKRLRHALWERSNIAALLMVVVVILVMVIPAITLVVSLSRQAAEFYLYIENLITHGNFLQMAKIKLGMYYSKPFLGGLAGWLIEHISALDQSGGTFPEDFKSVVGSITGMLSSIISNAFHFVINLVLTLFVLFVFYTKGESLLEEMISIAPLPANRARELASRCGSVIQSVFKSVVLTALVEGILGGLGFWVAGLPSPLLFGALIGVSTLVPYIGTALVWFPGVLYLILIGNTWHGIGLFIWCSIVVSNGDHLLRPLLSGTDDVLSTIPMLVGVVGGAFAFGFSGLILGPLTLVTSLFLLEEYHYEITEPQTTLPPAAP